jgi:hypothetical protein
MLSGMGAEELAKTVQGWRHYRAPPEATRTPRQPVRVRFAGGTDGSGGHGVVTDRAELIAKGRAAARSGSWPEAFDALVGADASAPLDPDDLETLAWAAVFSAQPEESVAARQRAFAAVRAVSGCLGPFVAALV